MEYKVEEAYLDKFREIARKRDKEASHAEADDLIVKLLRDLSLLGIAAAYEEITKSVWYA